MASPSQAGNADVTEVTSDAVLRRLRLSVTTGTCPFMFHTHDETKARAVRVGALVHETIGLIAHETLAPDPTRIMAAADAAISEFAPIEAKAHRQNIAAGTYTYFARLLPPATWAFYGSELHLGHGRLDLLWVTFEDELLIDEVKTGHARNLHLPATRAQVDGYRRCAVNLWGARFRGVRLLSTGDPKASLFLTPDGEIKSLWATDLVRGR